MAAEKIGGIIKFKINGTQYKAKGAFTYGLGTPKRESVMGADGFQGYKETPQMAFVEGEITDTYGTDLAALFKSADVTVLLELANGKSIVLREAFFAGDGQGSTEEGGVGVRFESPAGEEVK